MFDRGQRGSLAETLVFPTKNESNWFLENFYWFNFSIKFKDFLIVSFMYICIYVFVVWSGRNYFLLNPPNGWMMNEQSMITNVRTRQSIHSVNNRPFCARTFLSSSTIVIIFITIINNNSFCLLPSLSFSPSLSK